MRQKLWNGEAEGTNYIYLKVWGTIRILAPENREKSEIIYSELLPTGQIIDESIGNQEISEESDIDFENDCEKENNKAKHLYHSAKLLRSIVTDK